MAQLFRKTRYYYWLIGGFFKKYARVVIVVCVLAFFGLLFSRSVADNLAVMFSFNTQRVGIFASLGKENIPIEVLQHVSSGIVRIDDRGRVEKSLSTSWNISKKGEDYVLYTFRFPKHLVWQDGKPFVTTDINFDLFRFFNIKTSTPDPYTVRFELQKPLASFPTLLTVPLLRNNLVGIGGNYKISRIKYNFGEIERIQLTPLSSGLPFIVYKLYGGSNEMILAYQLGEIDYFTSSDVHVLDTFKNWRNTSLEQSPDYKKIVTLFINTSKEPFNNKNMREAIAQAVNYEKLEKYGARAYSPILPSSWAYNPDGTVYNFEPELSKSVIEKLDVSKKIVTLYTSYDLNEIADIVASNLKEVGLAVETRFTNYIPSDYDLFLTTWEPPIDPDQYVFWHQEQTASNLSKFKNVRADKFLEDGRRELSSTKRKQIYLKFQELIIEEVPAVFLYFPHEYAVARK